MQQETETTWQILESDNSVKLWDGSDNCYLITPSGFADEARRYLVIDLGPHFNGESSHCSKEQLKERFGIIAEQPEFDKI